MTKQQIVAARHTTLIKVLELLYLDLSKDVCV